MPKVVSTVLLSEAYCCRYLVAISPNSKVLRSDTGSSSYASIDGYCLNEILFNDAVIEAGSAFRALDVSSEFCFIVHSFIIHSFIHYGDLYSAPLRLLFRSAPDPCTAKKKSFETRVECVRKNPGEQCLRQRKPIPHRGTYHRECTGLGCGCTRYSR